MAYKYWQAWYQYSKPDGTGAVLIESRTYDTWREAHTELQRLRALHLPSIESGDQWEIDSGVAPSESRLSEVVTR